MLSPTGRNGFNPTPFPPNHLFSIHPLRKLQPQPFDNTGKIRNQTIYIAGIMTSWQLINQQYRLVV